jgi:hypothetical protein
MREFDCLLFGFEEGGGGSDLVGCGNSGFNSGFNCAESVNFATSKWIEIGRKAKSCNCVEDRSVKFYL